MSTIDRRTGRPAIVCLGDVFGDVIIDLTAHGYEDALSSVASSTNVVAPIGSDIGGSGVQLAVAARRAGFATVGLIGKVGARGNEPDVTGMHVLNVLAEANVDPFLQMAPNCRTGQVVVLFLPDDRRLMVSDSLANQAFTTSDVTEAMLGAVADSDVFHVSGYAWLHEARREATAALIMRAKESNVPVAFDLVPHDITNRIDPAALLVSMEKHVDWLFVELPTAHRLVYGEPLVDRSEAKVSALLHELASRFRVVFLQLSPYEAILANNGHVRTWTSEYEPGPASRGQSAKVQAGVLHYLVTGFKQAMEVMHE